MPIRSDAITATLSARTGSIPRMRRVAVATLACLSVLPVVAQAKSSFVIKGAGFGHGIGMSQYGADGYAQHGFDYKTIVGHYYQGTGLATVSPAPDDPRAARVRVSALVQRCDRRQRAHPRSGEDLLGRARGRQQRHAAQPGRPQARHVRRHAARDRRRAAAAQRPGGQRRAQRALPRRARVPHRTVQRRVRDQRGRPRGLRARRRQRGVAGRRGRRRRWRPRRSSRARTRSRPTPAAPPTASPPIPTRARRCTAASRPSSPRPSRPSRATRGQIVTYGGKPVVTYFFSTSGGKTENVENSFIGALRGRGCTASTTRSTPSRRATAGGPTG